MAIAVRAHVQACFDNEAVPKVEIEAATTAEGIAAVDLNTGWRGARAFCSVCTPSDDMTGSPAMPGRRILEPA